MKRLYLKYLKISHKWENCHSGTGFIQGTGFDIMIKRLRIGTWFSVLTEFKITADSEWLRKLKERMELDTEQQNREKNRH